MKESKHPCKKCFWYSRDHTQYLYCEADGESIVDRTEKCKAFAESRDEAHQYIKGFLTVRGIRHV